MKERDDSAKIRLLPPDDSPGGPNGPDVPRPWVGPLVIGGLLVVGALVLGMLSSSSTAQDPLAEAAATASEVNGFENVNPTTTTTAAVTTPPAPPLGEAAPDLDDPLTLVAYERLNNGRLGVVMATWDLADNKPSVTSTPLEITPDDWAFDPTGSFIALIAHQQEDGPGVLYIGSGTSIGPQFVGVDSFAWVAGTDAPRIAFMGTEPGGTSTSLYISDVASGGTLSNLGAVRGFPLSETLRGAGDYGFVTVGFEERHLVSTLWSPIGRPLYATNGLVAATSPDGLSATVPWAPIDAGQPPTETRGILISRLPDTDNGAVLLDTEFNALPSPRSFPDNLGEGEVMFIDDGATLINTQPQVGTSRWSLRAAGIDTDLARITSIEDATAFLGFVADDLYAVYRTDDGLAFHNWNRGTTINVDLDGALTVLAVGD